MKQGTGNLKLLWLKGIQAELSWKWSTESNTIAVRATDGPHIFSLNIRTTKSSLLISRIMDVIGVVPAGTNIAIVLKTLILSPHN